MYTKPEQRNKMNRTQQPKRNIQQTLSHNNNNQRIKLILDPYRQHTLI